MTRHGDYSIRLILLLVLIVRLVPGLARADDGSPPKPFRAYRTAAFGPIGAVYSSEAMAINNRRVQGQQIIWDGDLLETFAGANANAWLDLVGQVTLANRATVRLTAELDEDQRHPLLVAALIKGDMAVRLASEASAYIEAGDSAYSASRGASFRIAMRDGKAVIHEVSGAVTIKPQRKKATIKARGLLGRPKNPAGNEQLNLKTKERAELKALFEKISSPSTTRLVAYRRGATLIPVETMQSDQVIEKFANRVVNLQVQPPGIGTIEDAAGRVIDSTVTDAEGIILNVYFRAGDNQATGQIIATTSLAPDELADITPGSYTWDVTITKPGIFRTRNILILAAAAGIIVACCHPRKKTPQQNPPPQIQP
ncbi:MAG: hypothetical protein V7641_241 [Blastocatellia bacterium]